MKNILFSTSFLLAAFFTKAQVTLKREIQPFSRIEVSGACQITYVQKDTLSLDITGDEDEIKNIYTSQEGKTLIIKAKGSFSKPYKVYIRANQLKEVVLSGASTFNTENQLKADSLSFNVSGASTVKANVQAQHIDVLLSGASNATIEGSTQVLYSTISGASSLKSYKLNSPVVNVATSGASYARVFASEKINANATGSSTIKFKGDPKEVSAEASTSSLIAKVVDEDTKKSQSKRDSTTINFRNKQYVIISKDKDSETTIKNNDDNFHHWGGFGMGVNGWTGFGSVNLPPGQKYMELNYAKSLNFQLNLEKDIHLYKNYLNLVTGVGVEWSQYDLANPTRLNADSSYTYGIIDTTNTYHYKKNRFKTTFVDVPLLLELNTNKNPKKAFHIAAGVIGGFRLGSRTRQVVEQNGRTIRFVRKDDYNLNPFRVNAHVSIGYSKFTLYADYALTSLFKNGKGPELYPFTIGIKIISF